MPDCSSVEPLVTPYIDGLLPDGERQAVEKHLNACAPCRSRAAAEGAVRGLLDDRRDALQTSPTPVGLRERCAASPRIAHNPVAPFPSGADARRDAAPRTRRFVLRRQLRPLAIAAALVLVLAGASLYRVTGSSARVLAAELAADHVKCSMMNTVLRTHHAAKTVEDSFAYHFDWKTTLPADPHAVGLDLVGGRPCLYGEGRIAHIMYRRNGRMVSVFMLPTRRRPDALPQGSGEIEMLGHGMTMWTAGDRTFVLVAKESPLEIERLRAFVEKSLK